MTYLVMECHPSYAIVLDNEGRMIKAANMGYQEGQVVGEIIARQTPKAPILFRLAPLAAAACLCLAVLGGGAYGAYGMPYGTVEVRINPDVKMSVSYMDRVVGLEGVNEDGKKLIDQVSYKGRNSEYMTGILVERAMEMGYLTEGGTVYVAASGGSERWKAKRADAIRTGLDTLLKDGMPVEVHVESIGKDSPPAAPHHNGEIPGGTGGDKPVFIGMPPGGTGEDADGNGEDDRDEDERGDDTENDDEENDADPDKYDEDDGDDREEDAGKDKAGDKDDGRDDDGRDDDDKDDTDDRDDDIKKARDKSGRNNVVRQSSGADDDKDMDDSDERDNGKAGNGLNDNRDRDEDDGGEHSDQDDSDGGDSDEDDIDENDSQEEDNDGHEDGEDDEDEDEDDDD